MRKIVDLLVHNALFLRINCVILVILFSFINLTTHAAFNVDNGVAVVSNLNDLKEALAMENVSVVKISKTSEGSIKLPNGTYLSANSIANGDRKVVQVMEPFLPESGKVTVSGNNLIAPEVTNLNNYKLFTIEENSTVVISNLTLMGGFTGPKTADYEGSTGGIDNYGKLLMYDTTITRTGTALFNRPGATSVLVDCNIVRNANWFGGGILNRCEEKTSGNYTNGGTVIMDRCSFTENESLGQEHGGGAAENQGLMCLNNCVVANNASTEIGGGINNCKGGTLYVMNSTLTGNVTTSHSYGETAGGAIGNAGGAGYVYIVNSILANNGYDTGEHVNLSCLGRYENATGTHYCNLINTAIGATAGMSRLNATNTTTKVEGLFGGYTSEGIVAAGGEHDQNGGSGSGYSSKFNHPAVVQDVRDEYGFAPTMAQQDTDHFIFTLSVPTYFDYSGIINGTNTKPGMAYDNGNGITALGPQVSTTDKLVDVTYNGDSRSPNNPMGAVTVVVKAEDTPPPPGVFWVKLGDFTGGKVSGVTVYGDYYISNSLIRVHAVAESAHYLNGWMMNDEVVKGSEQQYIFSFHLTTNTTITPLFMPVETRIIRARQRYPWNNLVDIDYTVSEKDAIDYRLVFTVTYEDENGATRTVQLKSFVKNADGETPQRLGQKPDLRKAGEHRVTWDSAADNIRIKGKNVQLRLMACEGDER